MITRKIRNGFGRSELTVTGLLTGCTLDSSTNISLTCDLNIYQLPSIQQVDTFSFPRKKSFIAFPLRKSYKGLTYSQRAFSSSSAKYSARCIFSIQESKSKPMTLNEYRQSPGRGCVYSLFRFNQLLGFLCYNDMNAEQSVLHVYNDY